MAGESTIVNGLILQIYPISVKFISGGSEVENFEYPSWRWWQSKATQLNSNTTCGSITAHSFSLSKVQSLVLSKVIMFVPGVIKFEFWNSWWMQLKEKQIEFAKSSYFYGIPQLKIPKNVVIKSKIVNIRN